MIDKDLAKSASETANTIAKQLWPTMLFLVVLIVINYVGTYFWAKLINNEMNSLIAFWFCVVSNTTMTGFGIYGLFIDIRVHAARLRENASQ